MICNYCNKKFSNKSNLIKHQNTRLCIQNQNSEYKFQEHSEKIESQTKQIQEQCEKIESQTKHIQEQSEKIESQKKHIQDQSEKIETQTKQIQEQSEQLSLALSKIQELKEDNIRLQTRLEIYSEQKQDFHSIHNTTNNITIINQLQVLDLNPKTISKLASRHFSLDYLKQENKGVANFTINHVIKDSNGKPNYICTDPSRKIAKYKSADDNIVTDLGMSVLADTVYKSIKHAVTSLVMGNILKEWTTRDDNQYYKHQKNLDKNSPDFTDEIAKAVYLKNVV